MWRLKSPPQRGRLFENARSTLPNQYFPGHLAGDLYILENALVSLEFYFRVLYNQTRKVTVTMNTPVGALSERPRAIGNRPYDSVHSWWSGLPHDDSVMAA